MSRHLTIVRLSVITVHVKFTLTLGLGELIVAIHVHDNHILDGSPVGMRHWNIHVCHSYISHKDAIKKSLPSPPVLSPKLFKSFLPLRRSLVIS